ncbi:MAG: hypothetical protein WC244_04885 [Patescibacteria group bacterium]|jgi:hypothetical protein
MRTQVLPPDIWNLKDGGRFFSGVMIRHFETADESGAKYRRDPRCGNDTTMFALVEQDDPTVMGDWFYFLDEQKNHKPSSILRSILVVGSRLLPMMMLYHGFGGRKKFGRLRAFANACDTLIASRLNTLPPEATRSLYNQNGGEAQFGELTQFATICDFLLQNSNARLRLLDQAQITTWKF